jgi:hypothetical protein
MTDLSEPPGQPGQSGRELDETAAGASAMGQPPPG